jgi:hypothetical protein
MALIVPSRRGFLAGLGALVAAPAVIRVAQLMPIKAVTYRDLCPEPLVNHLGIWVNPDGECVARMDAYGRFFVFGDAGRIDVGKTWRAAVEDAFDAWNNYPTDLSSFMLTPD